MLLKCKQTINNQKMFLARVRKRRTTSVLTGKDPTLYSWTSNKIHFSFFYTHFFSSPPQAAPKSLDSSRNSFFPDRLKCNISSLTSSKNPQGEASFNRYDFSHLKSNDIIALIPTIRLICLLPLFRMLTSRCWRMPLHCRSEKRIRRSAIRVALSHRNRSILHKSETNCALKCTRD